MNNTATTQTFETVTEGKLQRRTSSGKFAPKTSPLYCTRCDSKSVPNYPVGKDGLCEDCRNDIAAGY